VIDRRHPLADHQGMDTETYLIIAAVFLAAGVVKGISGLGLPTISMALLSLLMVPAKAAMLMVLPSFATNIAQCFGPHWRRLARSFWPLWTCLALLTLYSPFASIETAAGGATAILAVVLIAYGIWGWFKPSLPEMRKSPRLSGVIVGALSGLLAAATGVFVMPLVPYMQSQQLAKEEFIQGLGISFMIATVALSLRLGTANLDELLANLPGCATALIAAFLGLWMGARLRGRLNPSQFQRALYGVFVVLGSIMLGRSL
jgi:uncharacterized membrane protein YfcA